MAGIVALRGTDCGCGMGDDAAPAPPMSAPMTGAQSLLWVLSLSTVGYIFWRTLQSPKRRRS